MAAADVERRQGFPLGWAIAAVGLIALLLRTVDVLLLFFLAVILAVYLHAVADVLCRRAGVPTGIGLLVGTVASIAALVGVFVLIIPPLIEQVQGLITNLPTYLANLDRNLISALRRVPFLGRALGPSTPNSMIASVLGGIVGFFRGAALPYLKGSVELLIEVISVGVMAIYLARQPRTYVDGLVTLVPPRRRQLARTILTDLRDTFRAWIVGQLFDMIILGVLTTLLLWMAGVPYFLAFGTFAGVAAIVPFFGTLFSTIVPALFVLGADGVPKALIVVGIGVGVHLVEANFVSPLVMERQVNVPPVLTILGVLLVGKLFGLGGIIIAVPILALVMVLVRHVLVGAIYDDVPSRVDLAGTVPGPAPGIVPPSLRS